jgi:hypothetical protein
MRALKLDEQAKISPPLARRMGRTAPEQPLRALVMLAPDNRVVHARLRRRPASDQRSRTAREVRERAAIALPEIDRILEEHDGKRLAGAVSSLGVVPVVSTAAGLRALAECEHVKAILEDQPISLLDD